MGLDARIVSAHLAAPYRAEGHCGKNDANDAAAICEAASRPHMRFVPVKSIEQQSLLCVHRLREGIKADRTACINRIRGLLLEFGVAVPNGSRALRLALDEILEDGANEMNGLARLTHQPRSGAVARTGRAPGLVRRAPGCPRTQDNEDVRRAAQLMGIGPVGASAAIATVGDFKQFKSGAQFGAWLGLVPKQHSSGGKSNLGTITKRGDAYLRTLLIQGAKSVVNTAHTRSDPISRWVLALKERSGWQKAVVALANKNARILWAVMTRGERFDPHHVSVKPGATAATA